MNKTILLVEDELLLQDVTSEDLKDLGFETICADNGDRALEILRSDRDLTAMVTDIRMPGSCDGWKLAREARALRPGLPVIYLSGYTEDGLNPVPGGVFLHKPYRFADIREAAERLRLI